MLSMKKHNSILYIEIGKEGDNKNKKKQKKKENSFFLFYSQETSCLIISA